MRAAFISFRPSRSVAIIQRQPLNKGGVQSWKYGTQEVLCMQVNSPTLQPTVCPPLNFFYMKF